MDNTPVAPPDREEVAMATEEARSIGLSVNESKTKLLLSTAKDTSIVSVEIDGYYFEVVKDFVHLQHKYRQRHQSENQT